MSRRKLEVDKLSAKYRLREYIRTTVRTVMIGVLEHLEAKLGYLWGHGKPYESLNDEEKKMRRIWKELRTAILDLGNDSMGVAVRHLDRFNVSEKQFYAVKRQEFRND